MGLVWWRRQVSELVQGKSAEYMRCPCISVGAAVNGFDLVLMAGFGTRLDVVRLCFSKCDADVVVEHVAAMSCDPVCVCWQLSPMCKRSRERFEPLQLFIDTSTAKLSLQVNSVLRNPKEAGKVAQVVQIARPIWRQLSDFRTDIRTCMRPAADTERIRHKPTGLVDKIHDC